MVAAARRGRAGVAGRDPGDVRAVERGLPVEREAAALVGADADEGARDDHLRRRPLGAALRVAGRVAEALRVEERALGIDPVVDDGDLHPLTGAAARCGERAGADQSRAAVERERVAVARVELSGERELRRPRELRGRQLDRHAVEQDRVVAVDRRFRDRALQRRGGGALRALELGHVRLRGEARRVQPPRGAAAGERARVRGQRRIGERQDHRDPPAAVSVGNRDRPGAHAGDFDLAVSPLDRLEAGRRRRRGQQRHAEGDRCDEAAHERQSTRTFRRLP